MSAASPAPLLSRPFRLVRSRVVSSGLEGPGQRLEVGLAELFDLRLQRPGEMQRQRLVGQFESGPGEIEAGLAKVQRRRLGQGRRLQPRAPAEGEVGALPVQPALQGNLRDQSLGFPAQVLQARRVHLQATLHQPGGPRRDAQQVEPRLQLQRTRALAGERQAQRGDAIGIALQRLAAQAQRARPQLGRQRLQPLAVQLAQAQVAAQLAWQPGALVSIQLDLQFALYITQTGQRPGLRSLHQQRRRATAVEHPARLQPVAARRQADRPVRLQTQGLRCVGQALRFRQPAIEPDHQATGVRQAGRLQAPLPEAVAIGRRELAVQRQQRLPVELRARTQAPAGRLLEELGVELGLLRLLLQAQLRSQRKQRSRRAADVQSAFLLAAAGGTRQVEMEAFEVDLFRQPGEGLAQGRPVQRSGVVVGTRGSRLPGERHLLHAQAG